MQLLFLVCGQRIHNQSTFMVQKTGLPPTPPRLIDHFELDHSERAAAEIHKLMGETQNCGLWFFIHFTVVTDLQLSAFSSLESGEQYTVGILLNFNN